MAWLGPNSNCGSLCSLLSLEIDDGTQIMVLDFTATFLSKTGMLMMSLQVCLALLWGNCGDLLRRVKDECILYNMCLCANLELTAPSLTGRRTQGLLCQVAEGWWCIYNSLPPRAEGNLSSLRILWKLFSYGLMLLLIAVF